LQAAARGDAARSLFQLALVWSNGLFAYLIAAFTAKLLYRRGFNRLATGGSLRRRYGGAWMDRLLTAALPFVSERTRLLIVKDFRTFRRDPQQWAQILIFTGLITLSITVARRIFVADLGRIYQNFISFFYVGVVGLLICIYTGRFVFPLFSLEGRKFWILGLLPIERGQLLWGKFAFASTGAVIIGEFLVLLSDLTLGMTWPAVVLHVLTTAVLAFGLSGLSVGLGACLPNFRETDPSRIVSGFGGTMNLLVSLLFLLVVLALMAGPWHALTAWGAEGQALWTVFVGQAAGAAVGAAAVILPLRMGVRALREMEF
jgi:ABC-2 type transport system permease protein